MPAPYSGQASTQVRGTDGLDLTAVPNLFKQNAATASGSTALWTPATGKRFRLMRYMLTVSSNASAASAALLVLSLLDGGSGTGQSHVIWIPVASVATAAPPLYVSPWIDLGPGILSAAPNNVLNLNLSFALANGDVNAIACGIEE